MSMTKIDLLVFGPHPDDIEIGFGGAVALHASRGHRVGLCDLTRGELGSNGTVEDRLAEAEAARAVLGAEWRVNLGWPDGGPYEIPEHASDVVRLVRTSQPR
nr:PIG-L family deacetylase [Acidobacteriota bacterium]